MKLRLPPFGRELQRVLANPSSWPKYAGTSADAQRVTIWIAFGPDSWHWAHERRGKFLLMICPPSADPKDFNWCLLADEKHAPLLIQSCGPVESEQTRGLIGALVRDGVRRILHLGDKGSALFTAEECPYAA